VPRLIVDFATLTGAARVALGNEIPALFSNNESEAMKLSRMSREVNEIIIMCFT
jgi:leucyl aminopeptidase